MKLKKLKIFNKSRSGRNASGKITVRHLGGRFKRKIRLIDMRRRLFGQVGLVIKIGFDPNRQCNLALIYFKRFGFFSYIIAPEGLKLKDKIFFGKIPVKYKDLANLGSSIKLQDLPNNAKIYNIELKPNAGGQLTRSAGVYSRIMRQYITQKGFKLTGIEMASDKICYINSSCIASLGIVSGKSSKHKKFKNAGQIRRLGIRPSVRGVAMNPVDHPHGGGEGKTSGGRVSVSPWGLLTKGGRTRKLLKVRKLKSFIKKINKNKI